MSGSHEQHESAATAALSARVLVTLESGSVEVGTVVSRTHVAPYSVLVRFDDRSECWLSAARVRPWHECGDCGSVDSEIHVDSYEQRGEPICTYCAAHGAFAP